MKRALCFIFLIATLVVTVPTKAQPTAGVPSSDSPAGSASELRLQPQPIAAALMNCGGFDGQACTTPGDKVRCEWIPGEPGRCVCTTDLVWQCG